MILGSLGIEIDSAILLLITRIENLIFVRIVIVLLFVSFFILWNTNHFLNTTLEEADTLRNARLILIGVSDLLPISTRSALIVTLSHNQLFVLVTSISAHFIILGIVSVIVSSENVVESALDSLLDIGFIGEIGELAADHGN